MATYAFETITAEHALNIQTGDYLTFAGGPASKVSVTYSPSDLPLPSRIDVTFGGRTVTFGPELAELSQRGALDMGDHSRLLIGDEGRDAFMGLAGDDALFGGAGNDSLQGFDGDDRIDGGSGADFIHGNKGDDELHGGAGRDSVYGGQGDDVIWTGVGDESGSVRLVDGSGRDAGDYAHGNLGDDQIHGSYGDDTLLGGQGNDTIDGGAGDDVILGDLGDDVLNGGLGLDEVFGGQGNDTLNSGMGDDYLNGGSGDDLLVSTGPEGAYMEGADGSDTLVAGAFGADWLGGGLGRDHFHVLATGQTDEADADVIFDWEASDKLAFFEVFTTGIVSASERAGFAAATGEVSILPMTYSEFVTTSYDEALRIANEHIAFAQAKWVAAQVGEDVYVFYDAGDPADGADAVVKLLDTSLGEIGLSNFSLG